MKHIDYKNISLFQMETCINVARFGSITKAAAALHSSQPAVSKIITRIEEELGYVLFIRGKTISGAQTPADNICATSGNACWLISETQFTMRLKFKTTCPRICYRNDAFGQYTRTYTTRIAAFREVNPEIELRIDNCSIPEAKERLCNETADIALVNPFLSENCSTSRNWNGKSCQRPFVGGVCLKQITWQKKTA
jgi:hypothetical protein